MVPRQETMARIAGWSLAVALAAAGCGSSNSDVGFGSGGGAATGGNSGGTAGNGGGNVGGEGNTGGAGAPGGGGSAGASGGGGSPANGVDLRADVNRDGTVDISGESDETGEDSWDATHGAIFLANIDDDEQKCPTGSSVTDAELAACYDGANDTVDGNDDLDDLARLEIVPWPSVPVGSAASISWAPASAKVRLFKNSGASFTAISNGDTISDTELHSGVELAIEGTDILRDSSWDGYVTVTITQTAGGSGTDSVKLRMSPVMLFHHVQDAVEEYVTPLPNNDGSTSFRAGMQAACTAAGITYTELPPLGDQWTQDYFETGYESMPAPGGTQKVIRVYFRSPNYTSTGLRKAGRVVYEFFRGKDKGGITQYDPNHADSMDTLDKFGNTETIPPYGSYPLGRIIRGSTPLDYPDQSFEGMLAAQAVQTPFHIDTSWLLVKHVDETLSWVKVSSPRGWVLLANDAALAKQMLEDAQTAGYGNTQMFVGEYWASGSGAATTINNVLASPNVMDASANAVTEVDNQIAAVKAETGLTDAEIVKIPFLHWTQNGSSVAYQPGTVNLAYVGPQTVAVADPHGPVIGGEDIFKDQMQKALAQYGISVSWVEDWDLYHRLHGEVHCGSNTDRAVMANWWESGK
jgi:protein-arginine deiminase